MDYTITLTATEKKVMDTITTDIDDWITNAAQNRARIAKEERYWRIDNQELEFIWKPTPDTELFCHVERVHYDSPTYLRFK